MEERWIKTADHILKFNFRNQGRVESSHHFCRKQPTTSLEIPDSFSKDPITLSDDVRWWLGCIITSSARYLGSVTILSFGDWIPDSLGNFECLFPIYIRVMQLALRNGFFFTRSHVRHHPNFQEYNLPTSSHPDWTPHLTIHRCEIWQNFRIWKLFNHSWVEKLWISMCGIHPNVTRDLFKQKHPAGLKTARAFWHFTRWQVANEF